MLFHPVGGVGVAGVAGIVGTVGIVGAVTIGFELKVDFSRWLQAS